MIRILLATLLALLAHQKALPQSSYGWFTGKASLSYGGGGNFSAGCSQLYNIIDQASVGMGAGVSLRDGDGGGSRLQIPVMATLRIGLFRRRPPLVMSVASVMGGYAARGGACCEFRLGLEQSQIRRARLSLDIVLDCQHGRPARLMAAAGLLF